MRITPPFLAALCLPALLVLSGCAFNSAVTPETAVAITGHVHGGQQPVVGAHIYMLAASTTNGAASKSLLTSVAGKTTIDTSGGATNGFYYVTTAADGSFLLTNDYACTAGQQVYLYALGGNTGTGTNSAAGFLATLGNCPGTSFPTSTEVWMNEVSTVVTAYALAGYATDALHVSSSGSTLALAGIATAFASTSNMIGQSTGNALALTPAGNATVPQQTINTIASALAACVNTTSGMSTNCSLLFGTHSAGASGTIPTDTATSAIYIAHNPGYNITVLYAVLAATAAFQPTLSTQPNDLTLALNYTGGGLNKPEGIAVDAAGNVWVANYGLAGITKILNTGAFATNSPFTGGGVGISEGLAIDSLGQAWVANYTKNSISVLSNAGNAVSGTTGYTGGGLTAPSSIAIDASGYVWVGDATKTYCVSEFTSAGVPVAGYTSTTDAACSAIFDLAIDYTGNVWAVSNDNSALIGIYGSQNASVGTEIHGGGGGGITSPAGVAITSAGNFWIANGAKNSTTISEFRAAGTALSGAAGVTGGGINTPYAIAIDGASNVWIANSGGPSVSEFTGTGTAITPAATTSGNGGYTSGNFSNPYSIAVDGSGNVWIADEGSNTVIELVGAGTPVVTPLVASLKSPYTATASQP